MVQRDLPSYTLSERYGEVSWGASGAGLDLLVQVGGEVVSTGLVMGIIAAVRRVVGRSRSSAESDSDQVMSRVRETLGAALGSDPEDVTVELLERGGAGWRVIARKGRQVFKAEVAIDGTVTFRRTRP